MIRSKVIEGWRHEGEVIGFAKGEAKGRAEGASVLQQTLRRLVEKQFNGATSADVLAQIAAQHDLTILSLWFQAALQANSLDELRQAWQAAC